LAVVDEYTSYPLDPKILFHFKVAFFLVELTAKEILDNTGLTDTIEE